MNTVSRRLIASLGVAAGLAMPMAGFATAADASPAAPAASASKPHASMEKIQDTLKSIQKAKKPADLKKELDKDIKTLKHNEAAVPSKDKKDYNKFIQELHDAKVKHKLDGKDADSTLKKIQEDAKELSEKLKKDSK